jgi:hypothetical protein
MADAVRKDFLYRAVLSPFLLDIFVDIGDTRDRDCRAGNSSRKRREENISEGYTSGSGMLDIGGSLRIRSEFFDNFTIKGYGTNDTDDLLLERVRVQFDYRLPDDLHFFLQGQDAHFWLSDLRMRDFGTVCPHQNPFDLRKDILSGVECTIPRSALKSDVRLSPIGMEECGGRAIGKYRTLYLGRGKIPFRY